MSKERKRIGHDNWKYVKAIFVVSIVTLLFSTIGSAVPNEQGAPLQNSIKQAIINGNLSAADIDGTPQYIIEVIDKSANHIKIKSYTKIIFKNPKGAGYKDNNWPKFDIKKINGNDMSPLTEGDYEQKIKDAILSEIMKISDSSERAKKLEEWNKYDFYHGPRTYEFNETYEVTYPKDSLSTFSSISSQSIYTNDILMGFTKTLPRVDWAWETSVTIFIKVASVKAGIQIDGALGLRLPTNVSLNMPNTMISGSNYNVPTSISGENWDDVKYSLANVPAENGNEFVARYKFFFGVQFWFIGIGSFGPYVDTNKDYSSSFATPIGPNERFPLPVLVLNPDQTGLKVGVDNLAWAGVGLKISPDLSSSKITAVWIADGDSLGSGSTIYSSPNVNYNLGPIMAGDYSTATNNAHVKLSDYKYYFNTCRITLSVNVQIGGILLPDIGSPYHDFYDVDCSGLTGGFYLGIHQGTSANSVNGYSLVNAIPPPVSSITVTSPNGGETLIKGTTNTIKWSSYSNPGLRVKIELLKGGVLSRTISSSTYNDGSYSWNIPSTQVLGNDYKIRITSVSNRKYNDTSDNNFTIIDPIPNLGGNQRITVKTDRLVYNQGSPITFTLKNVGSTSVWVNPNPITIKDAKTGIIVYDPNIDTCSSDACADVIHEQVEIKPRGTYKWTWNQKMNTGYVCIAEEGSECVPPNIGSGTYQGIVGLTYKEYKSNTFRVR